MTLNGAPVTIVGVAPEGFSGVWLESPVDAWAPLSMQAAVRYQQNYSSSQARSDLPWLPQAGIRWLELLLRADRAQGPEVMALNAAFRTTVLRAADEITDAQQRALFLDRRLVLDSLTYGNSLLRDRFRAPLLALMTMVALLLVIACANTANLLLARAMGRRQEMALRLSLGASRRRVVTQLLTESLLLGALAAVAGLAIAPVASNLLVRMTIGVDAGPLPFSVGLDARVVAFTAGLGFLTSLLFGLAPALRATDVGLSLTLKTAGRTTTVGRTRLGRVLVVTQVALSLLLVVGAGLFLRSFRNLERVPLGFEPEHLVSVTINPRTAGYEPGELPALYQRVIDGVRRLPGVESATISMCGLMTGCRANADGLSISGYEPQPGEHILVQENRVGPGYFSIVGMAIVEGRGFDTRDRADAPSVALVNETLVRRYFQGRDPVGQRFGAMTPDIEIIGVVRDARVNTVREAILPMVFYPFDDTSAYAGTIDVRASGDPHAVAAALQKTLRDLEPRLPVDRVATITDLAGDTLRQERLISRLTIAVSALALGLACVGGLLAYGVKQRTRELGLRLALGAPRPFVLWSVFRESLVLIAIGLGLGASLALGAARLVGTMLFQVGPSDPATLATAMVVLALVGGLAGYLPAWRASRVDPLIALRQE